jgi:hypothetical protein
MTEMNIDKKELQKAMHLADRIEKGLPPRNDAEAAEMAEAQAFMKLFDAFAAAPEGPEGDQVREDMAAAARARVFGEQN